MNKIALSIVIISISFLMGLSYFYYSLNKETKYKNKDYSEYKESILLSFTDIKTNKLVAKYDIFNGENDIIGNEYKLQKDTIQLTISIYKDIPFKSNRNQYNIINIKGDAIVTGSYYAHTDYRVRKIIEDSLYNVIQKTYNKN
jgi:hypothetical protein